MIKHPKICHIVGARPNFIKIAPIMRAFGDLRPDVTQKLVHTGQHYDANMSGGFFEYLDIPRPHVNLGVGSASHARQTAQVMIGLEEIFLKMRPDCVLVVGDVNSTMAAAVAAAKLRIPVAHVEAGLRSFDRSMPEEINRIVTDALSQYHFVTSRDAIENLRREGISKKQIHFVGNVMIDTLLHFLPAAETRPILRSLCLETKPYCVLTLHRPSNVDDKKVLKGIVEALSVIQKDMAVVFPLHPRTEGMLKTFGLLKTLTSMRQIILVPPMAYLDFVKLYSKAAFVMTDSGGVQEETSALKIPCLTLRNNTERPVTVALGTNRVIGSEKKRMITEVRRLLSKKQSPTRRPPLWDGKAARRIVNVLSKDF